MKLTILVLALFFLSCEKEEQTRRTPKNEVCLEIQSSSPIRISGNIGETQITQARCAYVVPGDSVHIQIQAETPTYLTIKLYKNNKLVVYKANHCAYTFYQLTQRF